jgi:UDP-N-acetylglucosamine 2-epimerase (non-hydrolysing)
MLIAFEKLVNTSHPDLILVLGDVNSTLAASLAAVKLNIPVAHVESGLRSFDRAMPEEINRILTDHISSIHFATEEAAVRNLSIEGISGNNVHLVGNVMIDALLSISDSISTSRVRQKLSIENCSFSVATLHRPSNVDNKSGLDASLKALTLAASHGQVIFPMHPRTARSLLTNNCHESFNRLQNLKIVEPLGYADFINLVQHSTFVMTDSGGIQSEASYLRVPCITLRNSTEHLITIEKGTNSLTGMDPSNIEQAISRALSFSREEYEIPEELDGKASQRIAEAVSSALFSGA